MGDPFTSRSGRILVPNTSRKRKEKFETKNYPENLTKTYKNQEKHEKHFKQEKPRKEIERTKVLFSLKSLQKTNVQTVT